MACGFDHPFEPHQVMKAHIFTTFHILVFVLPIPSGRFLFSSVSVQVLLKSGLNGEDDAKNIWKIVCCG